MLDEIKAMQEADLDFAISEVGATIIINGQSYPCVLGALDERQEAEDGAISVYESASLSATIRKSIYTGKPIVPSRDTVIVERHGRRKNYRITMYGESASGHAIRLDLEALL